MDIKISIFSLFLLMLCIHTNAYKIGLGRADCTGPIAEIRFMGYAATNQIGEGLHLRQYSRAFIVDDNNKRVVFVSVDSLAISHDVKLEVIKRLQNKFPDLYTMENVMMSATHDHGAPGGHLVYLLYDISILGFVKQNYDILVDSIYLSIERAHDSLQEGRIFISKTEVLNASISRSPQSYLENPLEERQLYEYDVDKTLTQMQFYSLENELIGAFNWFSVHGTSMNNTNHLVTSDNLGYASMLLEKQYNPKDLPGHGKFVGAFACTHAGDVSPNIMGPKCEYSGRTCDTISSKCEKNEGECFSSGPGRDMFESTKIIASRIYSKALELLKQNSTNELAGEVSFIHQYIDMANRNVTVLNPLTNKVEPVTGCAPAMGMSFAAGTTDGPGLSIFKQGSNDSDNKLWQIVKKFVPKVLKEDMNCHSPKPILLPIGRLDIPYPWAPKIVPTQMLKIGSIVILGAPGEFTTMSGRRIRRKVQETFLNDGADVDVILAGLTNSYSSYVATPEEYQIQRYEGASTIYGPNTLTLYIDQYTKLARSMNFKENITQGPIPSSFIDKTLNLNTGVVFDGHPIRKNFGYVTVQPKAEYGKGETVKVSFVSGNPRNDLMIEKTFLTVERTDDGVDWKIVATDADWETIMRWERTSTLFGHSLVHISWEINEKTRPGIYRIKHFGNYKNILGTIKPYEGTTEAFGVLRSLI